MTTYINIVRITNTATNEGEAARAFTHLVDAEAFIAECKRVERRPDFIYEIDTVKFDGNPIDCY